MAALSDPKLEAFAFALLRNIAVGMARGKAATQAAREAGYSGSSLADNARKRANRKDVKARMAELAVPIKVEAEQALALDIEGAKLRLAEIIRADTGMAMVKPADVIAAVRQLSTMEGWDAPKKMEHTGANGQPLFDVSKLNDEQLVALEAILAAVAGSDQGGTDLSPPEGELH